MARTRSIVMAMVAMLALISMSAVTAEAKGSGGSNGKARSADARGSDDRQERAKAADRRSERSEARPAPSARGQQRSNAAAARPASRGNSAKAAAGSSNGNSGTIKIASLSSDTHPNNEPHPGCLFRVDFYGFRAGTFDLTLAAHAPTGSGTLATDSVTLSSSARGNTFQTSRTYDLTDELSGFPVHEQQGYHVRVDVKRVGSNGNGAKTKVFWLDCAPAPAEGGSGSTPPAGGGGAVGGGGIDGDGGQSGGGPQVGSDSDSAGTGTRVLGVQFTAGNEVAGSAGTDTDAAALAFTGGHARALLIIAALLLLFGSVLLRASRRTA